MTLELTTLTLIAVLAPLVASVLTGLWGSYLGRVLSHSLTIVGVTISTLISASLCYQFIGQEVSSIDHTLYYWINTEAVQMQIGFLLDPLTVTMMLVVSFVSLMVHIYTIAYMHDDPGYQRFFSYISLFTFAMLMLVTANNFLQLFFGWEAVGLVSYLLIGFWFKKPTAIYANLKESDFIVTKTDTKGKITYCNDAFMEYSGFYEEELLGNDHDMIRHPEMPKAVFKLMKDTLHEENEFLGFIKNQCKDGGEFWTFLSVTPSFDAHNQLLGYFSVHRAPKPEAIEFFQPIYQQMCEVEAGNDSSRGMDESLEILMTAVSQTGDYNEHVSSYYK
jgi:PAS domain S-box-containing protein